MQISSNLVATETEFYHNMSEITLLSPTKSFFLIGQNTLFETIWDDCLPPNDHIYANNRQPSNIN